MSVTRLLFDAYRIAHAEQDYNTVGNWKIETDPESGNFGSCHITVSKMSDPRYEILVAIHELVEATLCAERGIKQSVVDEFDKLFEAERVAGKHGAGDEPGDDPRAPYHYQHKIATDIERLLAHRMAVDWAAYEREVGEL